MTKPTQAASPGAHRMRLERSIPYRLMQAAAGVLAKLLFDLKVQGRESVPAVGGALIVSNHQSYLDPVLLTVGLPRPLNFIAKSELFEGRLRGWVLRTLCNAFPVHQGVSDVGAVRETIRRLQAGHLLSLYPEGARTPDGEIGPLLPGVGLIVDRAGVVVVPAVFVGCFEAWPIHRRVFRPGPVRIRYGPPLDFRGSSRAEIVATIDRTLREMLRLMREER